jgi:ribosomal-protein-alanine N-acetyltransferase
MNFSPFPELTTERLILRQIRPNDAADVFRFRSDADVMRYIPRPIAQTLDDIYPFIAMIEDFILKGERINWGICLKSTQQLIGIIGFVHIKPEHFRGEVGYVLAKEFHRQGIMREALNSVLQYGFEALQFHSIEAIVDADNTASSALLLDAGFRQEAYFREDFYQHTSFRNSVHYGMLAKEFKQI